MHTATASHIATPRPTASRTAYVAATALLLATLVLELVKHRTGYWQVAAFGMGADVALFLGAGSGLEKGQLHPRAVPLYNLLHRFWLPLALVALASSGALSIGYLIGGLAWC